MCHTFIGLSLGEITPQSGFSIPEKRKHEFDELTSANISSNFFSAEQAAQQPLSLSVAITTLNQSPTLSVREENPSKTYKRIDYKPLYSFSD